MFETFQNVLILKGRKKSIEHNLFNLQLTCGVCGIGKYVCIVLN